MLILEAQVPELLQASSAEIERLVNWHHRTEALRNRTGDELLEDIEARVGEGQFKLKTRAREIRKDIRRGTNEKLSRYMKMVSALETKEQQDEGNNAADKEELAQARVFLIKFGLTLS